MPRWILKRRVHQCPLCGKTGRIRQLEKVYEVNRAEGARQRFMGRRLYGCAICGTQFYDFPTAFSVPAVCDRATSLARRIWSWVTRYF